MTANRREHFDAVWHAKQRGRVTADGLSGNFRALKSRARLKAGERFLDVGCGGGEFAAAARSQFREVHGVDISSEAVAAAQARGVTAHVVDAGSQRLPYEADYFDAVVVLSMMQYVPDIAALLGECRRVLRPEGQCIVCVPNMRAAWRLWTLAIRGTFPRTSLDPVGFDGGTLHYFTRRSLQEVAVAAGFDVIAAAGVFCVPRLLESWSDAGPSGWLKREFFSAEVLLDLRARR
jgi:methionine biosynthesis protein MetW